MFALRSNASISAGRRMCLCKSINLIKSQICNEVGRVITLRAGAVRCLHLREITGKSPTRVRYGSSVRIFLKLTVV